MRSMEEGKEGESTKPVGEQSGDGTGRIQTRAELLHCFTLKTIFYREDCVQNA